MCDELAGLQSAVARYASTFDPALFSPAQASVVVELAARLEGSASALKARAAARAAEGRAWREAGHRSPAEALARATGSSLGAAKEALATGRRLADQPELAGAALSGELSWEKTAALAEAGGAAAGLVDRAKRASLAELREEVARAKAAAQPDPEARRRAVHARRQLRAWSDGEGTWHLRGQGCPEDGAQVMSVLGPLADARFGEARRHGQREDPAAYRFDALVDLFRHLASGHPAGWLASSASAGGAVPADAGEPGRGACAGAVPSPAAAGPGAAGQAGCPAGWGAGSHEPGWGAARPAGKGKGSPRRRHGAPVKLVLRVDYDTFLRGTVAEGETCELVGYGPVPVSVVRDLLETGDPFVAAVLTKAQQVVGVAHLGRAPNAWQRTALEWIYPSCAAEGCPAQAHLQADHREDWARAHFTALDLLDLLCAHHHALKTRDNWALVEGRGKRPMVPPSDPRHPRHHGRASPRPP